MAKKPTKAELNAVIDNLTADEIESLVREKREAEAESIETDAKELWGQLKTLQKQFVEKTGRGFSWLPGKAAAGSKSGGASRTATGTQRSPRKPTEWYFDQVAACLKKSSGRTASASDIREFIEEQGGSPNSVSTGILPKMIKQKLVEKVGRGQYKLLK